MIQNVQRCNMVNSKTQALSLSCVMKNLLDEACKAVVPNYLTESGIEIASEDQSMVLKLKKRSADYELSFIRTGGEIGPMQINENHGNFGIICGDRAHSQIVLSQGRSEKTGEYAYAYLSRDQLTALFKPGFSIGYLPKLVSAPILRELAVNLAIA